MKLNKIELKKLEIKKLKIKERIQKREEQLISKLSKLVIWFMGSLLMIILASKI